MKDPQPSAGKIREKMATIRDTQPKKNIGTAAQFFLLFFMCFRGCQTLSAGTSTIPSQLPCPSEGARPSKFHLLCGASRSQPRCFIPQVVSRRMQSHQTRHVTIHTSLQGTNRAYAYGAFFPICAQPDLPLNTYPTKIFHTCCVCVCAIQDYREKRPQSVLRMNQ